MLPLSSHLKTHRAILLLVLVFLAAGVFLRVQGLQRGLWQDEYVNIKRVNASRSWFVQRLIHNNQPPLFYLALRAWNGTLGSPKNEGSYRLFSLLITLGTFVLLLKMFWDLNPMSAALALGFFALLPKWSELSMEVSPYPMFFFFSALAYLGALRVKQQATAPRWPLALGLLGLACTHALGAPMILGVLTFLLIPTRGQGQSLSLRHIPWRLFLPPLFALVLFAVFIYRENLWNPWWLQFPSWKQFSRIVGVLTGGAYLPESLQGIVYTALLAGTGFYGFRLWKSPIRQYPLSAAFFGSTLTYVSFLFAYSLLFKPVISTQSALPIWVPGIGGFVCLLAELPAGYRRIALPFCLIFLGLMGMAQQQRAREPKEDFRGAMETLMGEWKEGDRLLLAPDIMVRHGIGRFYTPIPQTQIHPVNLRTSDPLFWEKIESLLKYTQAEGKTVYLLTRYQSDSFKEPAESYFKGRKLLFHHRSIRLYRL